jgi:hypothetical protein
MSPSNRRDLVAQTLAEYLNTGNENLFHTIIENGDEFIEELSARFGKERGQDAKLSIIILAREIRTKESADFLVRASLSQTKRIWEAALEGLAYQQLDDVLSCLRELSSIHSIRNQSEKLEYIAELIRSDNPLFPGSVGPGLNGIRHHLDWRGRWLRRFVIGKRDGELVEIDLYQSHASA